MASINDDAPALESTTSTGIRKGRAVLLKHLKHPELNESLKSQQQVTFRLVKSGKRSVLSFYSKIWIFNFFHNYSKIRMICLLIFENYSKIQNFSQLLTYLGRWVLITLIISKYYLLKGFLMPKLFKCVNRNTLLLKANISNMYKCTLYLNHQVTKSFVKDCWASDPQ